MRLSKERLLEIISEELGFIIESKKKELCTKRGMNKNHSAKTGRFTTDKDAGSWSVRQFEPGKKDCFKGVRKTKPRNTWTRTDCGRSGPYKCSTGKVAEDKGDDFTNCKRVGLDKDYKTDSKTGQKTVDIKQDLECAYKPPARMNTQQLAKYKELKDFEKRISDDKGMMKVRKDVFDEYQKWLDAQRSQPNEIKEPGKETDRERKTRIFGDEWNEMIKLSKGIT